MCEDSHLDDALHINIERQLSSLLVDAMPQLTHARWAKRDIAFTPTTTSTSSHARTHAHKQSHGHIGVTKPQHRTSLHTITACMRLAKCMW